MTAVFIAVVIFYVKWEGKISENYTPEIGRSLGIIGDDPTIDYRTYVPKIKADLRPGYVRIDFKKNGLNGMNIYGRLSGDSLWTKLAYNSFTPFLDTRPLKVPGIPECREYMAIGVMRDEEVTEESDVIKAVFGGVIS